MHFVCAECEKTTSSPWQQVGRLVLDLRTVFYFYVTRASHTFDCPKCSTPLTVLPTPNTFGAYEEKDVTGEFVTGVVFRDAKEGALHRGELGTGTLDECLAELEKAKEMLRGLNQ